MYLSATYAIQRQVYVLPIAPVVLSPVHTTPKHHNLYVIGSIGHVCITYTAAAKERAQQHGVHSADRCAQETFSAAGMADWESHIWVHIRTIIILPHQAMHRSAGCYRLPTAARCLGTGKASSSFLCQAVPPIKLAYTCSGYCPFDGSASTLPRKAAALRSQCRHMIRGGLPVRRHKVAASSSSSEGSSSSGVSHEAWPWRSPDWKALQRQSRAAGVLSVAWVGSKHPGNTLFGVAGWLLCDASGALCMQLLQAQQVCSFLRHHVRHLVRCPCEMHTYRSIVKAYHNAPTCARWLTAKERLAALPSF